MLDINIDFTGNLVLGFGRYCGKVLPEFTVFHLFESSNVFSVFFHVEA